MSKIIHLFRHGQTDWNVIRRLQGHTDIPLNTEGRKQAESLQSFFYQNPVDIILTSDLKRAQETAEIANYHQQAPYYISADFREVRLGVIEGLTHQEILDKYGQDQWNLWQSNNPEDYGFAFPDGESAFEALKRFHFGLREFCENYEFTTAGLCTHGLMIRRFLHALIPQQRDPISVPNCSIFTVEWDAENGFKYRKP